MGARDEVVHNIAVDVINQDTSYYQALNWLCFLSPSLSLSLIFGTFLFCNHLLFESVDFNGYRA